MVAPSVVQSTSANANSTSDDVVFSVAPTDDNLVVLIATMDEGANFTFPGGFTVRTEIEDPGDVTLQVAYKKAASEGTTYTISADRSDNIVVCGIELQDVDADDPIDVAASKVTSASNTYTPSSVTTTVADTFILLAVGADRFAVVTTPAGYTDYSSRDGGSVALMSYGKTLASATTENPGDFAFGVGNIEDWAGETIAFKNVSAGSTAALTGVSSTGSVGSISTQASSTIGLTGVSASGSVGSITPDAAVAGTAVLSGVSSAGSVGSISTLASSLIALTGVSATGSVGTLAPISATVNGTGILTGVSSSGLVGSISPTDGAGWAAVPDPSSIWTGVTDTSTTWTDV